VGLCDDDPQPRPAVSTGVLGGRLKLELKDITPSKYRLYKLGDITVTPDGWIWFSVKKRSQKEKAFLRRANFLRGLPGVVFRGRREAPKSQKTKRCINT